MFPLAPFGLLLKFSFDDGVDGYKDVGKDWLELTKYPKKTILLTGTRHRKQKFIVCVKISLVDQK